MKIAILGSTGFLGKKVLKKALDAGYQIKTLVRDPDKLGEFINRVEYIVGSINQTDKVEETISGTEAVISTVGPPMKKLGYPASYKDTMETMVALLEKNNIRRFVHIGGAAHSGGENESWSIGRRILRIVLSIIAKRVLVAKQLEWEVLKRSNLDYILIRPPGIMKNIFKGKGTVADEKRLARTKINVEDLAVFIVEQINSNEWIRKAPLVAAGK
jgi:putative NADH-flavin reductase